MVNNAAVKSSLNLAIIVDFPKSTSLSMYYDKTINELLKMMITLIQIRIIK